MPRDMRMCGCGKEVEDEAHFLDGCERWEKERKALWAGLMEMDACMVRRLLGGSRRDRVGWLLGGGGTGPMRQFVVREVGKWLAERERVGRRERGARGRG